MENGINRIFDWYKRNKPELFEGNYYGLRIGDIVKTGNGDYCIVYPSESYLVDCSIPVRYLTNEPEMFVRDDSRETGFQMFRCLEEPCTDGKTNFLAMEHLCWVSDTADE